MTSWKPWICSQVLSPEPRQVPAEHPVSTCWGSEGWGAVFRYRVLTRKSTDAERASHRTQRVDWPRRTLKHTSTQGHQSPCLECDWRSALERWSAASLSSASVSDRLAVAPVFGSWLESSVCRLCLLGVSLGSAVLSPVRVPCPFIICGPAFGPGGNAAEDEVSSCFRSAFHLAVYIWVSWVSLPGCIAHFFTTECSSVVLDWPKLLLIRIPSKGYLGCFQVWGITDKALKAFAYLFVCRSKSSATLDLCHDTGSFVKTVSGFVSNYQIIFQSDCTALFSQQQGMGLSCALCAHERAVSSEVGFWPFWWYLVAFSFTYSFWMKGNTENIECLSETYLSPVWFFFWWNVLVWYFVHF